MDNLLTKLDSQLKQVSQNMDFDKNTIGFVEQVDDVIAIVNGLDSVMNGEVVFFERAQEYGMVLDLNEDKIGVIILGDRLKIKQGDKVISTKKQLSVNVSEQLLGRHIDAMGTPKDDKALEIKSGKYMDLERIAAGVIERKPVTRPLQTGIISIDGMIPIGRGQRELIIGDRQTGKTAIAIDTIINQKEENVICVYVAIGQKAAIIARNIAVLKQYGAMDYTIVISATASEPASLQYLSPYTGIAIAEYFMEKGKDVLIIFDDLTKHAWAYREISLLLKRPPGREAYPGDVFYLHSRLLERSVQLSDELGGGSITALPIIETQAGDLSAYIPTNVISITDGQIYLEAELFNSGVKPAINSGLSVSRVGGTAQIKPMKKVAGKLRLDLAQYTELAAFAQFGSDLDKDTQRKLDRGARLVEILKQNQYSPMHISKQVAILYSATQGNFIDNIPVDKIHDWSINLVTLLEDSYPDLLAELGKNQPISDELKVKLDDVIKISVKNFEVK